MPQADDEHTTVPVFRLSEVPGAYPVAAPVPPDRIESPFWTYPPMPLAYRQPDINGDPPDIDPRLHPGAALRGRLVALIGQLIDALDDLDAPGDEREHETDCTPGQEDEFPLRGDVRHLQHDPALIQANHHAARQAEARIIAAAALCEVV